MRRTDHDTDPATTGSAPAPERHRARPWLAAGWGALVLVALAGLVAGVLDLGPASLPTAGAVTVTTIYSWALAARTGGRPVVFGTVALLAGVAVVLLDDPRLDAGAAVVTATVAAVLAVMATVPAVRVWQAARECVYALVLAAVGSLAVVGYAPSLDLTRFDYLSLALSLLGAFAVVYRLGAGLHGLGRRGVVVVLLGGVVLAVVLLYAELLRRYGSGGVVAGVDDVVAGVRSTLGAFPRPIEAALGVPALAWGCHMRARRRQGWWVCAFGAAATSSVAVALADPAVSLGEAGLSVLYGLAVGLVVGLLVIRADLAVTGTRGRRSRRAEEGTAIRPEPSRTSPLL